VDTLKAVNSSKRIRILAILPKIIAFYLPQFHPIPENDEWWGPGFTEWTNVTGAKPLYPGHYQPQLPADLGFYDLRVKEVRVQQAKLAAEYGVYGFCYYYYWFSGRKVLERPVYEMLASGEPNFPFCLCWANENWTRRWDGAEDDVLLKQKYAAEDPPQLMRDVAPFLADPRYIRVAGKPLVIVYRPSIIPAVASVVRAWRREAKRLGLGELYICGALTFGEKDPRPLGFDGAVEFPPHGIAADELSARDMGLPPEFSGKLYSYAEVVLNEMRRPRYSFKTFRTAMPSWDNSARTGLRAHIFQDADPAAFGVWLEHLVGEARALGSEFVFINAWNEWAEGTHLEPDRRFGHRWLEAVKNALSGRSTAQACIEFLSFHLSDAPAPVRAKLAQLNEAILSYERSTKVVARLFRNKISLAERFAAIHFSQDLPASIAGVPFFSSALNYFENIGTSEGLETVVSPSDTSYMSGWVVAPGVSVNRESTLVVVAQHQASKKNYFAITNDRKERPDVVNEFMGTYDESETRFAGFEFSVSMRGLPPGRYSLMIGVPSPLMLALGTTDRSILIEGELAC
jgi:hypothetical protein